MSGAFGAALPRACATTLSFELEERFFAKRDSLVDEFSARGR
jgi:hypothetical protein